MLEMRNISKNFEAVQALKNANLSLKKGEIRALLGSNGSGKSTLVKVLSGLVAPSGGEIYFDGQPVPIRNAKEARDLGIAVAYQDYSLIPKMSVLDNIMLSLAPCGRGGRIDEAGARETAQFYLNLLKIEVPLEAVVELLMPSTQSMIEIAKALALKPKILILDEATASLHSDEVDIVFEVLRKLKEEGTSVIVVTHRMNEIFRICDSCTILKSGETVAEGNIDQLDLDAIKKIVELELRGLYKRVEALGYQLQISDKAKEFVATKGYDVQFGARPLKRAIQNYIEDGVCERLLSGELQPGSMISVDKDSDKDELTFK